MKYIINIALALIAYSATAQKADSLLNAKPDYFPSGIRVGTDILSIIRTPLDDSFSGIEFNADIDFYRYYLAVELGRWEREFAGEFETYNNKGNYFRVGIDVNFLKKDPEKNMFFIGARYGRSTFSENFKLTSFDTLWTDNPVTRSYRNTDTKAGWVELTTGIKVRMLKFFWMGFTARYKFGLNTNAPRGFIPHDVPGYGRTFKENTWGFNYYVMFRIPVRKERRAMLDIIKK